MFDADGNIVVQPNQQNNAEAHQNPHNQGNHQEIPAGQANNFNTSSNFVRPPKPLQVSGDMANDWKLWLQQYEWFETATFMNTKPPNVQVANFMASIGPDAVVIFNTFGLTAAQLGDITTIKERFENHFTPQVNVTYERYTFNKMSQADGEPFDEFLT